MAVYAGGAAVAAILILVGLFYFFKQRRRGAREAAAAAAVEQERMEMHGFKAGDEGSMREKFGGEARPDNSWPEEERGGLLSDVPMSPGPTSGGFGVPPGYAPPGEAAPMVGGYDNTPGSPGIPPRSASAAPMGYAPPGEASPTLGYESAPPRSASAAPEGYGYGGPTQWRG